MYCFKDLLSRSSRSHLKAKQNKNQVELLPDYGTHYIKSFGVKPLVVYIENPSIVIGAIEANITWNANGYVATLITSLAFGRKYRTNPCVITIIPDPNDAYTTPLGDHVVPFKLFDVTNN